MNPLPSMLTPALPGAAADPGVRGRFPEAPDGGGARVRDWDGFDAALQAAGVAGSSFLTAGSALFSRVKQMEIPLGTTVPLLSGSTLVPGPPPQASPSAGSIEASAMLATAGGIRGGEGAAGPAVKTRSSGGASGGPVTGLKSEVETTLVPTAIGAPPVSHGSPGAAVVPAPAVGYRSTAVSPSATVGTPRMAVSSAGAASAHQSAGCVRASEVANSAPPQLINANGAPLVDVAGRIIDASGGVVGVFGLEGGGSLPTAGLVSARAGAESATPGGAIAIAIPRADGAVASASSAPALGAAPSFPPGPGVVFFASSAGTSGATRPGAAITFLSGSAAGPSRNGATPVSAPVSVVGLAAGPSVDRASPAPASVSVSGSTPGQATVGATMSAAAASATASISAPESGSAAGPTTRGPMPVSAPTIVPTSVPAPGQASAPVPESGSIPGEKGRSAAAAPAAVSMPATTFGSAPKRMTSVSIPVPGLASVPAPTPTSAPVSAPILVPVSASASGGRQMVGDETTSALPVSASVSTPVSEPAAEAGAVSARGVAGTRGTPEAAARAQVPANATPTDEVRQGRRAVRPLRTGLALRSKSGTADQAGSFVRVDAGTTPSDGEGSASQPAAANTLRTAMSSGAFTGVNAPAPVPQVRTVISSAGSPGTDGAAPTPGASAVAVGANASPVAAPTLRTSMASPGRILELANPVIPPDLPTMVPHAVKLALREGVGEVRIRLWPPELGGILIRMRIDGTEVTARIEAERMDVRGLLESMRSDLGRGMQEAGLKLTRLDIGPARPNESLRVWEAVIPASATSPGGGGGTQDRQGQGAAAGTPGQYGGFNQGDPGPRGEHAASGRAGNGREGAELGFESRSERGEAGLVVRGVRGEAAIDAWA